jgi:hypothetical protein
MIIIKNKTTLMLRILFPIWLLLYLNLENITNFFVYDFINLSKDSHLGGAVWFFIFEVQKVLLLLILIVFGVEIIRTYFAPERTRKLHGGKKLFAGNVLASLRELLLHFVRVPQSICFLGFVESGVPFGVTFSFLIAAPMINEVSLVLLFGLFGWKTTLFYMSTGLFIEMISCYVIGKLKLEKFVEPWVFEVNAKHSEITEEKFSPRIELRKV